MCSSDLDPALLATSGDLQEFVRWHLGISEEGRPPILDGWRGEILGGPLLDLLEAEQRAGITLTSSMAMLPGASVSGTWFWHPDARYFGIGRIGRDQLAAKEMEIGRVNQGKKNFTGAINRFKIVVTQYQTTRHVEEALLRLTECYMALGIVQEAQTAAAVLGLPGSGGHPTEAVPALLAHEVYTQTDLHEIYGGVVPELASRDHVRRLAPMVRRVLGQAGLTGPDLGGVVYTAGPGLVGALALHPACDPAAARLGDVEHEARRARAGCDGRLQVLDVHVEQRDVQRSVAGQVASQIGRAHV